QAQSGQPDFFWGETVECPAPNLANVWQCFVNKVGGEDIHVTEQYKNPEIPGVSIHSNNLGMEGRLLCGGHVLKVVSEGSDGEWFKFESRYVPTADTYVAQADIGILNSHDHAGQLLNCGLWPHRNQGVYGGSEPL